MWTRKTKEHYEKLVKEEELGFVYHDRIRKKMLLSIIKGRKFNRIVDIGCGTGRWMEFLQPYGKELIGLDISRNRLKKVKVGKTILTNCENIPINSHSVDLVLSIEVLQHVRPEGISNAVSEIKRLIAKNGVGIIVVKNKNKPFRVKPPNPINFFSAKELRNLFSDHKLQIMGEKLFLMNPLESTLRKFRTMSYIIEMLDILLSKIFYSYCDSLWVVIENENK